MTDRSGRATAPLTATQAAPASRAERIEAIDTLRGLALFGVLMVNLVTEFRVSIFAQFLPREVSPGFWSRIVDAFVSTGLEMKAFSLFSLLFGVGLAIQFERLERRPNRLLLLIRRLAALLAFGLVHLFLIWNGDILTEYAIAGLIVLPLLFAPQWALAAASTAFLGFYAIMPLLRLPIPFPSQAWLAQHVAQANSILGHGSFGQVLQFNIDEVASLLPLHIFVFPRTLGLFTAGAWLWRAGVARTGGRTPFLWAALGALPSGLLLTIASESGPWRLADAFALIAGQLAPVILMLGYAGAAMLLATGARTRTLVSWAAPLGRTAFTNYILQSVIFGAIFFGYGLGMFDRLDSAPAFLLGVAVFALQAAASAWWLRRFQFGPLEWLWRGLMYGRAQPMLRAARPAQGTETPG